MSSNEEHLFARPNMFEFHNVKASNKEKMNALNEESNYKEFRRNTSFQQSISKERNAMTRSHLE